VVCPVGTPRITADPELLTCYFVCFVANDSDFMVNLWLVSKILEVNVFSCVLLFEPPCSLNAACNRSILKFCLHCVDTDNVVERVNVVLCWVGDFIALFEVLCTSWRWWTLTIHALVHTCWRLEQVQGNVLLTGVMHKAMIMGCLVYCVRITSVARATPLVVHNHLGAYTYRSIFICVVLVQDIEPISNGRSSALRPAGATVLGYVLIDIP